MSREQREVYNALQDSDDEIGIFDKLDEDFIFQANDNEKLKIVLNKKEEEKEDLENINYDNFLEN